MNFKPPFVNLEILFIFKGFFFFLFFFYYHVDWIPLVTFCALLPDPQLIGFK